MGLHVDLPCFTVRQLGIWCNGSTRALQALSADSNSAISTNLDQLLWVRLIRSL